MNEKTMLSIAYESLKNKDSMTLKQIFDVVKKELKSQWKKERPTIKYDDINKIKLGELHKLLTIDGKFLRLKNSSWTLVEKYTPTEVKALKLQIQEMLE